MVSIYSQQNVVRLVPGTTPCRFTEKYSSGLSAAVCILIGRTAHHYRTRATTARVRHGGVQTCKLHPRWRHEDVFLRWFRELSWTTTISAHVFQRTSLIMLICCKQTRTVTDVRMKALTSTNITFPCKWQMKTHRWRKWIVPSHECTL